MFPKQAKSRWAEAGSWRVVRSLGRRTEDHSRGAAWRKSMTIWVLAVMYTPWH